MLILRKLDPPLVPLLTTSDVVNIEEINVFLHSLVNYLLDCNGQITSTNGVDIDNLTDGTGLANRLAVWTDANTITYDFDLSYDSIQNTLTVGSAFSISSLLVNSNAPLAVLWTQQVGYEITTNRFYAAGVSRFNSNLSIGGALDVSSTLNVSGAVGMSSTLGVSGALTVGGTLGVSGTTTFSNLVSINYGIDTGYWFRVPSIRSDSVTNGGHISTDTLGIGGHTSANTLTANSAGIGRALGPPWGVAASSLYSDGQVNADSIHSRSFVNVITNLVANGNIQGYNLSSSAPNAAYGLNINNGAYAFLSGPVGIGYGVNPTYWLNIPSIYSDSITCINITASNNVTGNGNIYTPGSFYKTSWVFDGVHYYSWLVNGNPNYGDIRVVAVHYPGNWAGIRLVSAGPTADINLSGGGATLSHGAWVDAPSDRELKTSIIPIDNPLERLSQMAGCSYERTDVYQDGSCTPSPTQEYGLIAQDVQLALPGAGFTHDFNDGRGPLWNYNNRAVLALLVSAVNALKGRVEILERG